jgi:hypothetical protein
MLLLVHILNLYNNIVLSQHLVVELHDSIQTILLILNTRFYFLSYSSIHLVLLIEIHR